MTFNRIFAVFFLLVALASLILAADLTISGGNPIHHFMFGFISMLLGVIAVLLAFIEDISTTRLADNIDRSQIPDQGRKDVEVTVVLTFKDNKCIRGKPVPQTGSKAKEVAKHK